MRGDDDYASPAGDVEHEANDVISAFLVEFGSEFVGEHDCRVDCSCIPDWYRFGMSTQIAVRLSDDMVAFIDELVSCGEGSSRAAIVARALERERRRKIAERDAEILTGAPSDAEMDRLAAFAAATPMPDLD